MIKKIILKIFIFLTISVVCLFAQKNKQYVKRLQFPQNATIDQKIQMAANLVPSKAQMAWQKLELTAFIHFGINTFTNREWGNGKESPKLFNPVKLNAEQWVKALKAGGFKLVIITAKHHDGFCLWQTKTTKHSVAYSPWKNGKGDVVGELHDACKKYGMKFGVYLSPWDRNAECYGTDKYNNFFVAQLTELLSNYGKVDEVWFDGACGEGTNGKEQVYDWDRYDKTVRKLQPQTVTAIMGTDIRWVGNEGGLGRKTEWSATVKVPETYKYADSINNFLKINDHSKDLGGRELLAKSNELFWHPSEVDVSIRPGWFYHKDQDKQVKSLSKLIDIYFESVGYNSGLLLNVPPNADGLFAEIDVDRLSEFGNYISKAFENNLIAGEKHTEVRQGETKQFELHKNSGINVLLFQEDLTKGQRMESFEVEAFCNGIWIKIAQATTIGNKRLIRIKNIETNKIRIKVLQSRGTVYLQNVGAFKVQMLTERVGLMKFGDVPCNLFKLIDMPDKANAAIDGDVSTFWKSGKIIPIVIELKNKTEICGFSYTPAIGSDISGTVYKYRFYTSLDGKNWTRCDCPEEFGNIMHNPVTQFVRFAKTQAKFVKFEPLSEINGKKILSIAEIGLLTE